MTEAEPAFLSAALLGLSMAGFSYTGASLRTDQTLAQLLTKTAPNLKNQAQPNPEQPMREAVKSYLIRRSEPTPYFDVHTAAVTAWIASGATP